MIDEITVNTNSLASSELASSSESLMLGYAGGDAKAFNELYHRHKSALFRFIKRQGIAESKTDELFQEIWMKIINARHSYKASAKFQTWFYRIARNHVIDDYRKQGNVINIEFDDESLQENMLSNEKLSEQRIEDQLDLESKKSRLLTSVSGLPFMQREAFLLKHEAGLNNEDIAKIKQSSAEAVKSRIRYAMKQLKNQLGGS